MRSRSVRLVKPTRSGALDLALLGEVNQAALARLTSALGHEGAEPVALCDVVPSAKAKARELADHLAALAHAARGAWLETGVRDLAVGWPFLEGRTRDGTWLRGPLLLYPVALDATKTGRARWALTPLGPPELNESLAQVLGRGLGARLLGRDLGDGEGEPRISCESPTLARLTRFLEEGGVSLTPHEGGLRQTSAGLTIEPLAPRGAEEREAAPPGSLSLRSHLVLGRFPRSDSATVVDYDQLLAGEASDEALGAAAGLLSMEEADDLDAVERSYRAEGRADATSAGGSMASVRWQAFPSDDSQDTALAYAVQQGTGGLVVQGPPGTGKSQLIANLVAAAVAEGRRVLVVCEKRAALDVVAARLASVGLREPVAVVHDVQRDRAEVCEALVQTLEQLEGAAIGATLDVEREARDQERDHALAMGRVSARADAAREAFTLLTGGSSGRPGLARLLERALSDDGRPLPDLRDAAAGATEAEAFAALARIESLTRQAAALAAPHPLATRTDWSGRPPREIAEVFTRVRGLDARVQALDGMPRGALTAGEAWAQADLWGRTAALLDIFEARDTAAIKALLFAWTWAGGEAAHGEWRRVTALLVDARATFEPAPHQLVVAPRATVEGYATSLARLDELTPRWYRGFTPEYWRLKKVPEAILAACPSIATAESDVSSLLRACASALRWQALIDALPAADLFWDLGLGGDLEDLDHAIQELRFEHACIGHAHDLAATLRRFGAPYTSLDGVAEALADHGAGAPLFVTALADRARARALGEIMATLAALAADFAPDALTPIADLCAREDLAGARDLIARILAAEPVAEDAARLDRLVTGEPAWVKRFLRVYRPPTGADPGADALLALERAWVRVTLGDRTIDAVEAPLVDEAQVQRLADEMESSHRLAGRGALARFRLRLLSAARDGKSGSGLRRLAADAAKKRSRPTLRQLVERYWEAALPLARPAWLCSPEAVSSLFPLAPDTFDLVIVDEASQCPVEAAVPVLCRARRAIVAGDDQQMPPSYFFRSVADDADEEDDESVLASASILGLSRVAWPGMILRWHYRSHHEELVAFSNAAFYSGRLITAPRADAATGTALDGLHWAGVQGLWVEQQNPIEAERVVDLVAELLAHDPPPSVGVVAFNRRQAELVEQRLDARAAEHADFRARIERDRARDATDQLFVRNLENVQGDERDVVILSTGYAPAEPGGKVHARFGPIGEAGGERRLNVATTRARRGVWVVSSIDPDLLDVSGTKNVGPKLLKTYLQFAYARADRGRRERDAEVARLLGLAAELGGARGITAGLGAAEASRGRLGDRVRGELEHALRATGLRVEASVGLGQRRIDLAVGLPGESQWRVGVDCTQFLRDPDDLSRDVYTLRFWRRLGWRLVRVTPGMWLSRSREVVTRIEAMVTGGAGAGVVPAIGPG